MIRKIVLYVSLFALIALASLAWLVYRASPGPASQVILGLTLGQFDSEKGVVFLSGRRLHCVPQAELPYTATCTITIEGRPLTIQAFRNEATHPNQLGGGCEAAYAGRTWPCEIGSRHVTVHWFAYISEPLGLEAAQMDALRRQYFFENLPEEPVLTGTLIFPLVVTSFLLVGLFAWQRPFRQHKWAATISIGLFTLITTFFFSVWLTSGFWD